MQAFAGPAMLAQSRVSASAGEWRRVVLGNRRFYGKCVSLYDFVTDACANGQQLRGLMIVKEYTGKALTMDGGLAQSASCHWGCHP
jgi:hypothetical protein